MSRLAIPPDTIEKMVCITCSNYLSFFPVYIKNDGSGAVCGRCKLVEEDKFLHDIAYENIAQFLLFPCCYKSNGCNEQLIPSKIIEHEKFCDHRKFECPTKVYSKCQWTGPYIDLKKHFEEKHPRLLLNNGQFELNFTSSYKENALMFCNDDLFIVKREADSFTECFTCSIQHLRLSDITKRYDCFLRLTSGDQTYSTKLPMKRTKEGSNSVKFYNSFIKEKLQNPVSVIINIELIEANFNIPEEQVPTKDLKKDPNINWDLLRELECPICFDFMLPPIYQCINGHSICSECKPKISACPICKNGIQETKNFALEKMTHYLTFPCKFFKSGCTYSAKSTEIRTHEENCEFGPYDCPLKEKEDCQCKLNTSEVVAHVNNNHADSILKSDKIYIPFDIVKGHEQLYLIESSGKVFKLHYKYADKKFLWSLQLVGPANECKKYKLEIDVVDNTGNNLRCYMRGMCVPLTEQAKSFTEARKYIMLIYEQVEPLITQTFSYRVRVIKD